MLRVNGPDSQVKSKFVCFEGAEGTLGVVTKVSILTPTRLSSKNVVFLNCGNYMNCQVLFLWSLMYQEMEG